VAGARLDALGVRPRAKFFGERESRLEGRRVPRMLTGLGHRVEVAKGGFEGLGRLKTGPAPHLVVLDMNMPGITGQETLCRLRLIHPTLPVIFGSGFMDLEVQKALLALPHVQLVPKPYTRDELRSAIRSAMIPSGGIRPGE
jgi:CheY-like chemotaxis protein